MCRTNIQQFIQFDILDYRILLPSSNIVVEWYRIEDSPWSRCSPTQFQTWFLHSHIGSAILLAPKNRMLAMLAPSSARSSAARVFYPSKIIIDWLHDFPNLQRIQCSIENNRSPCKTSLPLDAACLSKVHLKLFALCRRLTMLGWFNDHFIKSAQKVVLLKSHELVTIFDGAVLNLNAYAPGPSWLVEGDSRWQHYKYVKKDLSEAASKTQIHIACMQFKD